jgi:hypothetical protein
MAVSGGAGRAANRRYPDVVALRQFFQRTAARPTAACWRDIAAAHGDPPYLDHGRQRFPGISADRYELKWHIAAWRQGEAHSARHVSPKSDWPLSWGHPHAARR